MLDNQRLPAGHRSLALRFRLNVNRMRQHGFNKVGGAPKTEPPQAATGDPP